MSLCSLVGISEHKSLPPKAEKRRTRFPIAPTLKKALAMEGPIVVAISVDYRDNHRLMEILRPDVLNKLCYG
jgi:hypothetical protein